MPRLSRSKRSLQKRASWMRHQARKPRLIAAPEAAITPGLGSQQHQELSLHQAQAHSSTGSCHYTRPGLTAAPGAAITPGPGSQQHQELLAPQPQAHSSTGSCHYTRPRLTAVLGAAITPGLGSQQHQEWPVHQAQAHSSTRSGQYTRYSSIGLIHQVSAKIPQRNDDLITKQMVYELLDHQKAYFKDLLEQQEKSMSTSFC
ncbi:Hypothetical predicted protein [Xyrichtys novacula]|uniref:Uncharacterized protein n=1 Tax=Xyrichtys novacula TaxID=13765 RepID=A0AAV1GA11_XYRNO|nr:Hypothetical predicted protein [Xyrichtys novacula]